MARKKVLPIQIQKSVAEIRFKENPIVLDNSVCYKKH